MLMPIALAAAGALVCATVVGAQTPAGPAPDFPVVVITARRSSSASPDRAFVSIAAESRARTSERGAAA